MPDIELDKRIIAIAQKNPALAIPYLTLATQMGVNDERLAKYIKRLKREGKVPESFMPRRSVGQPRKEVHPHTMVIEEVKSHLKLLQAAGVASLPIPKIKKIIREKEREVLSGKYSRSEGSESESYI